jgi:hypothetical protein
MSNAETERDAPTQRNSGRAAVLSDVITQEGIIHPYESRNSNKSDRRFPC